MKLNDIDLFRLLPNFMRDDKNSQAFVYAIQHQLNAVSNSIGYASIYSRIDTMTEELLDELAWQFNIIEYSVDYNISIKRSLVKNCLAMHNKRGTVAAIEETIQKIFGNGTVEEWFEYGGEPYHFKVHTTNPEVTDEMLREIERIIKETQNVRSHLEEAIVELMERMDMYIGCILFVMDDISLQTVNL